MKRSRLGVVICISVSLLCGSCSSAFVEANSGPITAILGAFDEEIVTLDEQLTDRRDLEIEGIRFVTGELKARRVVLACTGIGKVNAAMTTTLLIEHFRPDEVIFTGIAGGINPELFPGDVVIAEKTAQHDLGTLTPSGLENKAVRNPVDGMRNPVFFLADERLLKLAELAAKHVKLEAIETGAGKRPPKVVKGVVVTGDVFAASAVKCSELRNRLGADAVEMEGAAVAQICYQQQTPCLVIRGISDKANDESLEDVHMFYRMAAENSASLVAKIAELLASEFSVEKTGKSR